MARDQECFHPQASENAKRDVRGLGMNVWAKGLRRSTVFLILVAGPLVPRVSASSVLAYSYSGVVGTVSAAMTAATGVIVGDTITGSFSYDSSQTGSATTGLYTFTGSSKVHTMTFKIFNAAGAQVFTDSYSGNATAYYAAQVSYSASVGGSGQAGEIVNLMGDTIYKQGFGITGPGPPPAFDLTLYNPHVTSKPSTFPLPSASSITSYVGNNQQAPFTPVLNWDPDGQSFSAPIYSFQAIPEPSSLAMGVVAIVICTLAGLIVRR
jgi:hypothetical protein